MDATREVTLDPDVLATAEAVEREPSALVAGLMRDFVEREWSAAPVHTSRRWPTDES